MTRAEVEQPILSPREAAAAGRILRTREVVYAATLELIRDVGVAATTIKRIADRTGLARSTIYRRWPDISLLYLEAFEQIVRTPLPKPVGDTEPELRTYLGDYANRLNDSTYFATLIGLIEWGWRNPVFADAQHHFFDERRGRAAAIVRAGRKSGRIRKDRSIADSVKAIEAPFLYTRMIDGQLITADELERVLAELMQTLAPRN